MKQPALRQYRRELLIHFPKGHAARNLLLAEFDRCLSPLLEELPDPSYQDLTAAFGTPEHMADTLADSVSVPPPFSRKKLAGVIGGVCVVVLCVALIVFAKSNAPEEQLQLETTPTPLTAFLWERVDSYDLAAQPIQWDQPKGRRPRWPPHRPLRDARRHSHRHRPLSHRLGDGGLIFCKKRSLYAVFSRRVSAFYFSAGC